MTKTINKKGQRLFALLLTLVMLLTVMPINAFAEDTNSDGYIEVRTIEDLYNIRDNLTANYILMNDIDLTKATAKGGDWDFYGCGWNPIGSKDVYDSEIFTGVFDGNGHSIIGLRIDVTAVPSGTSETVYAGLFARVDGVVKNLTCTGSVSFTATKKKIYIGGFAGNGEGALFKNCKSFVNVYAKSSSSSDEAGNFIYAGGVVGGISNSSIQMCTNRGKVETYIGGVPNTAYTSTAYASGIAGTAYKSTISMSYNTGNIYSTSQAYRTFVSGGISAGYYKYYDAYSYVNGISWGGTVEDSYNSGKISGGGDRAINTYSGITHSAKSISNSYNVGEVANGNGIGSGSISNCYYLKDSGASSTGATSLTDAQMKLISSYKGFDFDSVWALNKYANYPYPQLKENIQDMNESANVVSVIALPVKREYFTGDKLDFTGAMLRVVYVSGKEEIIDITNEMVSGFDMNKIGEQTVTVTAAGASDTFTINVKERPEVVGLSIISEPDKKEFAVGTAFDFTGAKAKITYNDETEEVKDIIASDTTGGNINHIGKQAITYSFGGKSASFEVSVIGIELEKILLTKLPDKLSYKEGQELDLEGMVLTAVMNNGMENNVSAGYNVEGYSSKPGKHTVTVTYLEKTATFDVVVAEKELVSIRLNSMPEKTEYISGQSFDESGMQVVATYDNGEVSVVEDYIVSGFDDVPGIKNIVISVGDKSVSFPVTVTTRVLTGFEITSLPSKLNYIEYETFDKTGLKAEATYNDGTKGEITDYTIAGVSSNVGTHTVSVAYGGFVKTFNITVSKRVLEKIVVTPPKKNTYFMGEAFDNAGLTVFAYYNNGQQIQVDDYVLSGFESNTPGTKTITVSYNGFSYDFAVAVQERSVIQTEGSFIVGNVIGRLGDKVVIPVNITKNTGIAGFKHTIKYNADELKFDSAQAVGNYSDGTVVLNTEKSDDGEITILWFGGSDIKGDGVVYNLTFEVLETANDGNTDITISYEDNDNGNISGENVIFGKLNGFVDVRSYWLGDLNGDRKYAMVDLLQLAQYVSGKQMTLTEKQQLSADVNEDGTIDIHDVIMLNKWLLEADI